MLQFLIADPHSGRIRNSDAPPPRPAVPARLAEPVGKIRLPPDRFRQNRNGQTDGLNAEQKAREERGMICRYELRNGK
jgi:hypothetical protein